MQRDRLSSDHTPFRRLQGGVGSCRQLQQGENLVQAIKLYPKAAQRQTQAAAGLQLEQREKKNPTQHL